MSRNAKGELHVALLAGGDSAERNVSVASGGEAAKALASLGHRVARFDPAEIEMPAIDWRRDDACFIALHGGAGEDGRVQAELEALGVPYTGSNPAASRLAMSKSAAKERFDRANARTLPSLLVSRNESIGEVAARGAARLSARRQAG